MNFIDIANKSIKNGRLAVAVENQNRDPKCFLGGISFFFFEKKVVELLIKIFSIPYCSSLKI